MFNDVTIIGGLPKPIGGVTTFVRRLVCSEPRRFAAIVDFYSVPDKDIPPVFLGDYYAFSKIGFFVRFCFFSAWRNRNCFFNFSRTFSLLFFLLWRKGEGECRLLLHHGDLQSRLPKFVLCKIFRKFDVIYYLNESQKQFYDEVGVGLNLVETKSYVPPRLLAPIDEVVELVSNFRSRYEFVYVCSGFPRDYYNLRWCIEAVSAYSDSCLLVFLYGDGELKSEFMDLVADNIFVFDGCSEDFFNSAISLSDFYLRPSSKDSFGVAVADAIELGCTVIASDVCPRYQGSYLFRTGDKNEFFSLVDALRIPPSPDSVLRRATSVVSPFKL